MLGRLRCWSRAQKNGGSKPKPSRRRKAYWRVIEPANGFTPQTIKGVCRLKPYSPLRGKHSSQSKGEGKATGRGGKGGLPCDVPDLDATLGERVGINARHSAPQFGRSLKAFISNLTRWLHKLFDQSLRYSSLTEAGQGERLSQTEGQPWPFRNLKWQALRRRRTC